MKLINKVYHTQCKEDAMYKNVKNPCKGCIYFSQCGDNSRTAPCKGRKTKTGK